MTQPEATAVRPAQGLLQPAAVQQGVQLHTPPPQSFRYDNLYGSYDDLSMVKWFVCARIQVPYNYFTTR